jgi:cystathionine beta-lyase/cystathionine gamma-synthase
MIMTSGSENSNSGFETKAIHTGQNYTENTGAVIPPVYLTSTFASGNPEGFDYTRSGNPNFKNLESTLASLENAQFATVFASGVSAITAVVSTLKSGDTVIAEENIYGCTYRLFAQVFEKFGIAVQYIDLTNPENYAVIESVRPALVWLESPTNPLLKIIDIQAIAEKAHEVDAQVIVDNTFASSYFQKPIALGADLSLSSTTKYTNGHSDCLGGVVVTDNPEWQEKMIFAQKALGLNPAPFDTWLIARGAKTMALRMEQHQKNALELSQYLESHDKVNWVRYPLLKSHPQYELAKQQMTGGSGIVTVDFNLSLEETLSFLGGLHYFTLAESLGGIESLICHPATMTHASIPKAVREGVGITDSLVRFSVGIETSSDLINDVQQALG